MRSVVFLDLGDGPVVCVGVVAQAGVVQGRDNRAVVGLEISLGGGIDLLAAGCRSIAGDLHGVSSGGRRRSSLRLQNHGQLVGVCIVLAAHDGVLVSIDRNTGSAIRESVVQVLFIRGVEVFRHRLKRGFVNYCSVAQANNSNVGLFSAISKRRKGHCRDQHDCYQQQAEKLLAKCLHFVFLLNRLE